MRKYKTSKFSHPKCSNSHPKYSQNGLRDTSSKFEEIKKNLYRNSNKDRSKYNFVSKNAEAAVNLNKLKYIFMKWIRPDIYISMFREQHFSVSLSKKARIERKTIFQRNSNLQVWFKPDGYAICSRLVVIQWKCACTLETRKNPDPSLEKLLKLHTLIQIKTPRLITSIVNHICIQPCVFDDYFNEHFSPWSCVIWLLPKEQRNE